MPFVSISIHEERTRHQVEQSLPKANAADMPAAARQHDFTFPVLNDAAPAQIDLGEITYLLSSREVRRLKEQGMLRSEKVLFVAGSYYCHRCRHHWQAASRPAFCPHSETPHA